MVFRLFAFILLANILSFSMASAQQVKAPLIIGIDADFSAVAVEGGTAIKRGVELAVEEINAAGGVIGRPIEIVALDHRGNPARGIDNVKRLSERNNLLAIVGGVHTPVLLAELDTIHKHDVLMLVPWAAGTPIIDNGHIPNNVFRISVRDSEAAPVLIEHAISQGYTSLALVLERTGWGRSNLEALQKVADEKELIITSIHWINWQQKDFSDDIRAIKKSDAEAIILVSNAPEGAVVLDEMASQDIASFPVISHWGIASGSLAARLSTPIDRFNISVLQTFHFDRQRNSKASKLLALYKEKYGSTDATSIRAATGLAHAYDLMHLIAKAANQANSVSTKALRDELESIANFNGAVKAYQLPFTKEKHDALWSEDYFMTRFNASGDLVYLGN